MLYLVSFHRLIVPDHVFFFNCLLHELHFWLVEIWMCSLDDVGALYYNVPSDNFRF